MRTNDEMCEQVDKASEKQENGEGFHGMSYEDGVKATLDWVMEETDIKPMDE